MKKESATTKALTVTTEKAPELILDIFDDKPMNSEEFGGISKEGAFKGSLSSLMSLVEKDNRK